MFQRVILLILDACGVGELPDAGDYNDIGASTIPNIARELGGLNMPNCGQLGLGNIVPLVGIPPIETAKACWGKMAEKSSGKDSTSGHWEIAGIVLNKPFPMYPKGFPPQLVSDFEKAANIKTIGNSPASGTEIIAQLGKEHLQTGKIILYTSADSVFQLAAHEDIIPLKRLYEICQIARDLLQGEHAVGRVIARPFIGKPGNFERTSARKDFSIAPPSNTILDLLLKNKIPTISIGKIGDLFAHQGFIKYVKTINNMDVIDKLLDEIKLSNSGLLFANLVDFDMLWGHRNDTESFGLGLEKFDQKLPEILKLLNERDLLIITADHGCDPTLKHSTDHTREYVPLLAYNIRIKKGISLGIRESFSDIGQTVAEIFNISNNLPGKSFLKDIVLTLS
jgi:phosphopentomutase